MTTEMLIELATTVDGNGEWEKTLGQRDEARAGWYAAYMVA